MRRRCAPPRAELAELPSSAESTMLDASTMRVCSRTWLGLGLGLGLWLGFGLTHRPCVSARGASNVERQKVGEGGAWARGEHWRVLATGARARLLLPHAHLLRVDLGVLLVARLAVLRLA